jgi:hypothetical protein
VRPGQSASDRTSTCVSGLNPSRSAMYACESAAMRPIRAARASRPALAKVGSAPGTSTSPSRSAVFTGFSLAFDASGTLYDQAT